MARGAGLEVVDLHAGYGKMEILHGIDMKVEPGEFVAIVGPNGSGKSTFLKAVFGLINIYKGAVILDGENITREPASRRPYMGMAYVPQTNNVFPNLTVEENLKLSTYPVRKEEWVEEEIEKVYEMFPILRERRRQKAGTLSGGERQFLALARALVTRPRIMLLDEPTAAVAPKLVKLILSKIKEINEQGITVILVEQNARKALEIAERGYIFVQGKIAYTGPSREILSHPELGKIYLGLASA